MANEKAPSPSTQKQELQNSEQPKQDTSLPSPSDGDRPHKRTRTEDTSLRSSSVEDRPHKRARTEDTSLPSSSDEDRPHKRAKTEETAGKINFNKGIGEHSSGKILPSPPKARTTWVPKNHETFHQELLSLSISFEIRFLKEMLLYYQDKKIQPYVRRSTSEDFMKNYLKYDVSADKLRKWVIILMERYKERARKNVSSLDDVKLVLELGDRLWGNNKPAEWQPPPIVRYKINTAAAKHGEDVRALAAIIRDYRGKKIVAGILKENAKWDPEVSEAMAFQLGIQLAKQRSLAEVILEIDRGSSFIDIFNNARQTSNLHLLALGKRINDSTKDFFKFNFSLGNRSSNRAAITLAELSKTLPKRRWMWLEGDEIHLIIDALILCDMPEPFSRRY